MGSRRNARKTRKRKGEGRQRRNQEKRRRRQEEASHRQHVPSLRWIPQKSGKEQTQQTPNRARKEEEDPCRAQKAPQHRPFGNRKTPRKSHRVLDRLVRPRRGKIRPRTKNQPTKIRHQPTPPSNRRHLLLFLFCRYFFANFLVLHTSLFSPLLRHDVTQRHVIT